MDRRTLVGNSWHFSVRPIARDVHATSLAPGVPLHTVSGFLGLNDLVEGFLVGGAQVRVQKDDGRLDWLQNGAGHDFR